MLARRNAVRPADWQSASHSAQLLLAALPLFRQAQRVGLYAPLGHEIDTELLFQKARRAGKQLFYPLVCGEQLVFHGVTDQEQLYRGSFGILEPCPVAGSSPERPELDLLVVPGVAFDLYGHRIGFGKGYYDRYLAALQRLPVLVGLCHDFQVCDELPAEGHDVRMDFVVTESRVVQRADRKSVV